MDKQKQIEEMAKDMLDFGMATYPTSDSVFTEQKLREQFYQVFLAYAEHLVYKGYCKILEGAVVLTREEYDDMFTFKTVGNAGKHCGFYNILDTVRKVERKETAEKFAEMLKEDVSEDNELHERLNYYLKRDYFEYIDGRCKEIIGETK